MALVAPRQLSFSSSGDLSQATVTSEVVDVRDMRNFVVIITTTGAPTGSIAITHYYGNPQHTPTGKTFIGNPTTQEGTFAPAGSGATYKHIVNSANGMPCSAYSISYTRTSGSGTIAALQQCKGSGSA